MLPDELQHGMGLVNITGDCTEKGWEPVLVAQGRRGRHITNNRSAEQAEHCSNLEWSDYLVYEHLCVDLQTTC